MKLLQLLLLQPYKKTAASAMAAVVVAAVVSAAAQVVCMLTNPLTATPHDHEGGPIEQLKLLHPYFTFLFHPVYLPSFQHQGYAFKGRVTAFTQRQRHPARANYGRAQFNEGFQ